MQIFPNFKFHIEINIIVRGDYYMLFLSIDFGTSAVKLSILDEAGSTKCQTKQEYPYLMLPGEKVELSPNDLFSAFFSAARQLDPAYLSKVEFICYDTFSPSLVFLDKEGELIYPNIITHLDRRSRAQSEYIQKTIGSDAYMKISGIYPFTGGCSAMTLLWFRNNEPDILQKTYQIGHLTTYLHKKFTGLWMVDLVNASMLGLYETTTQGSWSKELISEFQMCEDWFPDIHVPGTFYGTLLPEIAHKLGLKEGIPVAIGTNDVASAQMGAHNHLPGQIMNTAGSSEMVSILTDHPITSPRYYLRNAALPGLWQIYATTSGGFALDWFYKEFCREMSREEFYEHYLAEALDSRCHSTGISFDPYLTGDRQSLSKKTAAWHGLTLSATREEMLYTMLQSIQNVLYSTIQEAGQTLSLDRIIKISGGMVSPAYFKLKQAAMPGFQFQNVVNCPILGNMELVKHANHI